jgi:hypothetical protein
MDVEEVIKYFGGTEKTCGALAVTKGAVSQWRQDGIPELRQFQIEALTRGKFKADRKKATAA